MKLVRIIVFLFHVILIIILFLTRLNAYVTPQLFPYLNLLSLAFPILLALHFVLCLFWIISWKKRAFIFTLLSVFLYQNLEALITYNEKINEPSNLKIISFNIKGGSYGTDEIDEYFSTTDADVIMLQESGPFTVSSKKHHSLNNGLVNISSKFRIIHQEILNFDKTPGSAILVDLDVEGKTIRFINIYLHPFSFEKDEIIPSKNIEDNKVKSNFVIKKLTNNFKIHQDEINRILTHIENSPYPVILGGDFNAVPNSYEYYQISNKLTDSFIKVGRGFGISFHDYIMPLRIDYLFSSDEIIPINYEIDRRRKLSDHYPVIGEYFIKK